MYVNDLLPGCHSDIITTELHCVTMIEHCHLSLIDSDIVSWCRLDSVTSQLTAEVLSLKPSLTHDLSPVVGSSHQPMSQPN